MVLNEKVEGFNNVLPPGCQMALQNHYKQGHNLKNDLIPKYLIPLKDFSFPDPETHQVAFYHYTKSKAVAQIAHENRPMDIFDFLRTSSRNTRTWFRQFYVASDPISSREYGPFQIIVFPTPNALILDESLYVNNGFAEKNSQTFATKVEETLATMFPLLKVCLDGNSNFDYILYYLSAEDHEVDFIRYMLNARWFQVLNPYAIDHLELGSQKVFNP